MPYLSGSQYAGGESFRLVDIAGTYGLCSLDVVLAFRDRGIGCLLCLLLQLVDSRRCLANERRTFSLQDAIRTLSKPGECDGHTLAAAAASWATSLAWSVFASTSRARGPVGASACAAAAVVSNSTRLYNKLGH